MDVAAEQTSDLNDTRVIRRDCPSCDTNNYTEAPLPYAPPEWPMKQCRQCDLVYLEKAWALDILYEEFDWSKSVATEDQRRSEKRGLERRFSKRFRKWRNALLPRKNIAQLMARYAMPGAVLDVGAGDGFQLLQLPESYTPYGIEISSEIAARGNQRLAGRGGHIINNDALGGLKQCDNGQFTGIMMRSFLEHDERPRDTLQEAQRALATGGILIIKVPNYACLNRHVMGENWCGFRFPEHQNYFTPQTLRSLVEQCGLRVRRFGLFDRLPISDNMWLIAEKTAS